MNSRLIVMSMQLKSHRKTDSLLNESQISPLLAALSFYYEEAAAWITKKNVIVMVVGDDALKVRQFVFQFESEFKSARLFYNEEAETLLNRIADGAEWRADTSTDKFNHLISGRKYAMESKSLGPVLHQLVDGIVERFKSGVLAGNKNSWSHSNDRSRKPAAKVDVLQETFYHFGIN